MPIDHFFCLVAREYSGTEPGVEGRPVCGQSIDRGPGEYIHGAHIIGESNWRVMTIFAHRYSAVCEPNGND